MQNRCFPQVSFDPFFSPGAPTGDANTLDNVDAELTDVDKEEHEEPEWAVTPADGDEKADIWTTRWWSGSFVHPKADAFVSFTWTPHKVVCTSRQTNTAWRGWTRGWTSRSPPPVLDPHRTRPCSPPCWRTAFLCELQHKRGNRHTQHDYSRHEDPVKCGWGADRCFVIAQRVSQCRTVTPPLLQFVLGVQQWVRVCKTEWYLHHCVKYDIRLLAVTAIVSEGGAHVWSLLLEVFWSLLGVFFSSNTFFFPSVRH